MKRTEAIIIGAGQAGLALSRCLTERNVDHAVLERGRVAQRWEERWDSLQLLSPNWMTRLPGFQYRGDDPDGFMRRDEVIDFLRAYARSFAAPVEEETDVLDVRREHEEWRVTTDRGIWRASNVVIATGHSQAANVPACASRLRADIDQITSIDYRNPEQLAEGGVLVIGASASGVQLAEELRDAGREVVLAVGRHTRFPRRYRGRDILYWLDRLGFLRRPLVDVRDPEAAKREASLQLVGSDDGRSIDLGQLSKRGVRLAGRLVGLDGDRARFSEDLAHSLADADAQLKRILFRIDRHISAHGSDRSFPAEQPIAPLNIDSALEEISLRQSGIRTVLWATGYRRSYPWLHADVFDARGEIRQDRGRTSERGLYTLGLQFMIRRNSSFIDGVGRDAEELAAEIAASSAGIRREAA